jgi:hypothetical protein
MKNKFKDWVDNNLVQLLNERKIKNKIVTGSDSMLGGLYGIQLENELIGGHIYFWDSKTINYNLFSFEKEEDIIKEALINDLPEDTDFSEFFTLFIKKLTE